jgi:hypothetical protein
MSKALTPREERAIRALLDSSVMRKNFDIIAGCNNSPDLMWLSMSERVL